MLCYLAIVTTAGTTTHHSAAPCCSPGAAATKDASRILGTTVNMRRHGQFDDAFGAVVCGLRLPTLRYPGGGESQWWDWRKGWVITEQQYLERFPTNTTAYPQAKMAAQYIRGTTSYTVHNLKKHFIDVCNRTQGFVPGINVVLNIVSGDLEDQLDFLAAVKALAIRIEAVELGDEFHSPNRANVDSKFPNGTFFASYAAEWARAIKQRFPGVPVMVPARRQDAQADPPGTRQALWTQQLLAGLTADDRGARGVDSVCMHPYWTSGCGVPGYSRNGFWGNVSVQQEQWTALGTEAGVGSALANVVSAQQNDVLKYIHNFSTPGSGSGLGFAGLSLRVTEMNVQDYSGPIKYTWIHALQVAASQIVLSSSPIVTETLHFDVDGCCGFAAIFTPQGSPDYFRSRLVAPLSADIIVPPNALTGSGLVLRQIADLFRHFRNGSIVYQLELSPAPARLNRLPGWGMNGEADGATAPGIVGTVLRHEQGRAGLRVGLAVANLLPVPATLELESLLLSDAENWTLARANWTTLAVANFSQLRLPVVDAGADGGIVKAQSGSSNNGTAIVVTLPAHSLTTIFAVALRAVALASPSVVCNPFPNVCFHDAHGIISTLGGNLSTEACCTQCHTTPSCQSYTRWIEQGAADFSCRLFSTVGTLVGCKDQLGSSGCADPSACPTPPPAPAPTPPPPPAPRGSPNIVFIAIDDLRPQLGCYGHNVTHTPNIDGFAKQALRFTNAHAQIAHCSPSRNSLMSGRAPDIEKVWNFINDFRDPSVGGNTTVTLPQFFKERGWHTWGTGKVFHPNKPPHNDQAKSWSDPYAPGGEGSCRTWGKNGHPSNFACDSNDDVGDSIVASNTVAKLVSLVAANATAASGKPFFLAAGIHKPHLPYYFLPKFATSLPVESEIAIPSEAGRNVPTNMPPVAWMTCMGASGEEDNFIDFAAYNITQSAPVPASLVRNVTRGYMATAQYVDHMVGTILDSLKELGLEKDTIVAIWGDRASVRELARFAAPSPPPVSAAALPPTTHTSPPLRQLTRSSFTLASHSLLPQTVKTWGNTTLGAR